MEKLDFKVGDIAKIKLSGKDDIFGVGTEVKVVSVDIGSGYYAYKVEVIKDSDKYFFTNDWVSADHLEKLSKIRVGNVISYQDIVEAVINEEFEEGYLIEYIRHVGCPLVMEFNGHSFVGKNNNHPLCLNKSSATCEFKLLGVEEVAHTYRLPDSIAKAVEIGTYDAYLNYGERTDSYWFDSVRSEFSAQTNFTEAEFAKIPDMDGLKQLLIKGEAK